jgi:hypothetical protein
MKRFLSKLSALALIATMLPLGLVQSAFAMDLDAGEDLTVLVGSTFTVESQVTNIDMFTDTVDATFLWGDGLFEYVYGVEYPDYITLASSHSYTTSGLYTVEVTAIEYDVVGDVMSTEVDYFDIDVLDPMTVDAGVDQSVVTGQNVTVTGAATDQLGDLEWAQFDWGDGSPTEFYNAIPAGDVSVSSGYNYEVEVDTDFDVEVCMSDGTTTACDIVVINVYPEEEEPECVDDIYEENDDMTTAYEVFDGDLLEDCKLCGEANYLFFGNDDPDYYKIELNAGDTVTVNSGYTYESTLMGMFVVDELGEEVEYSEVYQGNITPVVGEVVADTVALTAEETETYYILVSGMGYESEVPYTLEVLVDEVEGSEEEEEESEESEPEDNGDGGGGAGASVLSQNDDDDEDEDEDEDDEEVILSEEGGNELADAADEDLECESPFEDTDGHWAEKTICLLYEAGVVSGRTTSTFVPNDSITRAELLKMILLNAGEEVEAVELTEPYTDVSEDDWYYEYVTYGTDLGVVEGYEDGSFQPNKEVNRAEAIVMLLRMAEIDDPYVTCGDEDEDCSEPDQFDDVEWGEWYAGEVARALEYGIVEGYEEEDGSYTFGPDSEISRAEAAKIVRRAWYVWYQ